MVRPLSEVWVWGTARQPGQLTSASTKKDAAVAFGALPLSFESNQGQTDPRVNYLACGSGYALFLSPREATFLMQSRPRAGARNVPAESFVLRMNLLGSDPAAPASGGEKFAGRKNYLVGNDRSRWQRDIPMYGKVKYSSVYPGIDLLTMAIRSDWNMTLSSPPALTPPRFNFSSMAPTRSAWMSTAT